MENRSAKLMEVNGNTELRHLPPERIQKLSQILDSNGGWAKLMEKIPKNLDDIQHNNNETIKLKYTTEDIRIIKEKCKEEKVSMTVKLIEEWGTSGIKRVTIQNFLDLLISVPLYRAAEFVATKVLKRAPPLRPSSGPAQRIDIDVPSIEEADFELFLDNLQFLDSKSDGALSIEPTTNGVSETETETESEIESTSSTNGNNFSLDHDDPSAHGSIQLNGLIPYLGSISSQPVNSDKNDSQHQSQSTVSTSLDQMNGGSYTFDGILPNSSVFEFDAVNGTNNSFPIIETGSLPDFAKLMSDKAASEKEINIIPDNSLLE